MSQTLPCIDRVLDPVAACLTPEVAQRITEVRLDPPTMARLEELREKANEGTLNSSERMEYEEFVEAYDLLILLKNKAKAALQQGANG
jgi:hypothetical protein